MAPMPDDDGKNGFDYKDQDYPPHPGMTKLPPSMVTSTITQPPAVPTTIAYFVGYWLDDDGSTHSFTISEFDNLSEASAFQNGAMPTGNPWEEFFSDYWSEYVAPATQTQKQQNYPAAAATTSYSTAAQTSIPPEVPQSQKPEKGHGPPITALAVGIIVPIVVCLLTIVACIFCVSHYRRKARRAQAEGLAKRSSEMQEVGGAGAGKPAGVRVANDERAYLAPPHMSPTVSRTAGAGAAAVPLVASGAMGSQQDPPVILSTTMNNGFFTGIDTSDAVSISDQRSMASHDTFGEEPPPPYRPRSVPPISRETSVRTSIISTPDRNSSVRSGHRQTLSSGSITRRSNQVRSPFDDPEEEEEDDDLSDTSTIRGRRETDRLSIVSDLSYQDTPTGSRTRLQQ